MMTPWDNVRRTRRRGMSLPSASELSSMRSIPELLEHSWIERPLDPPGDRVYMQHS